MTLIDLPGIYNLSGSSIDEAIASKALRGVLDNEPAPDLIIAVVDATNLERNLYLVTQLIDLGIPMLLVLSMSDIALKRGIEIRKELLSRELDLPVLSVVAVQGEGLEELTHAISKALIELRCSSKNLAWLDKESAYYAATKELGELAHAKHNPVLLGSAILSEAFDAPSPKASLRADELRKELKTAGVAYHSLEATNRYKLIHNIITKTVNFKDNPHNLLQRRIDWVITDKFFGSLIFILIMASIFNAIFVWASVPMDFIDAQFTQLSNFLRMLLPEGEVKSLIVDGIVPGVGSVLIFIPQIALLFFFIGLLEDSGYLSRAAFLMDKIMRRFGLQGRSFIPLLSSFACAIPGIMSTRTIPSFADRMITIMVAPLMSCSARLPVYTLLIAAFIPRTVYFGFVSLQGLTLLGMYLLGIIGAALVALGLRLTLLRGEPTLFVMEMPHFKFPSIKQIIREVVDRIIIFVKNAGTIILACSILLWFLASYPRGEIKQSFAGQIGVLMEPLIKPLGYDWEIGIGLLASFAAREVFVSTLATVYNLESSDDSTSSLIALLKQKHAAGNFSMPTALSLMVFFVFACQCMSTLAVCRRETGSWSWTAFMFIYMTLFAYIAAFITYQLSTNLLI